MQLSPAPSPCRAAAKGEAASRSHNHDAKYETAKYEKSDSKGEMYVERAVGFILAEGTILVHITETGVICWDDQCCPDVAYSIQTDYVAFFIDHIFFLQFLFKLMCANVLHFNNFHIKSFIVIHFSKLSGGWFPCSGRRSVVWPDSAEIKSFTRLAQSAGLSCRLEFQTKIFRNPD